MQTRIKLHKLITNLLILFAQNPMPYGKILYFCTFKNNRHEL